MIHILATLFLLTPGLAWDAVPTASGYQAAWFGSAGVVAFTNTDRTTSPGFRVPAQPLCARVLAWDAYGQTSEWTDPLRWPAAPVARTNLALPFALPALESTDLRVWRPCMERTVEFSGERRFFRPSHWVDMTFALPLDPTATGWECRAAEQPDWTSAPYTPAWAWEWDCEVTFRTLIAGVRYWVVAIPWRADGSQGNAVLLGEVQP